MSVLPEIDDVVLLDLLLEPHELGVDLLDPPLHHGRRAHLVRVLIILLLVLEVVDVVVCRVGGGGGVLARERELGEREEGAVTILRGGDGEDTCCED